MLAPVRPSMTRRNLLEAPLPLLSRRGPDHLICGLVSTADWRTIHVPYVYSTVRVLVQVHAPRFR